MPQRTYGRFCGLARALELVGDRWTLLLIRQLIIGPKRYNELLAELPGISTKLLAERLRRMEQDGLVARTETTSPAGTSVYELTPYGREVEPVILELLRWGSRLLADPARMDEPADPYWPLFPLRWLARQHPAQPPLTICVAVTGAPRVHISVHDHEAELDPSEPAADLTLTGTGSDIAAVLGGQVPLEAGAVEVGGRNGWLAAALQKAYR